MAIEWIIVGVGAAFVGAGLGLKYWWEGPIGVIGVFLLTHGSFSLGKLF